MSGRYTEGGDELFLGEAVAEGADYMDALDAKVVDSERWYWVCDPETLDMGGAYAPCGCITAQHHPSGVVNFHDYGLFYATTYGLSSTFALTAQDRALAVAFNFNGEGLAIVDQLTALWVEEINDRRAAWFDRHPEAVLA